VVGEEGDAENGEEDEAGGEHRDGDEVATELSPVGLPRGGVEQRRKEDEEDDLGVERDAWDVRDEGDRQASEDEEDRVGELQALGETGEQDDNDQKEETEDFQRVDVEGGHV